MSRWLDIARAAKEGQIPEHTPVPIVPIVPKGHERGAFGTNGTIGTEVQLANSLPVGIGDLTDDQRERYEERAAIIEFDGGRPRHEAERMALLDVADCRRSNGGIGAKEVMQDVRKQSKP